MFQTTFVEKIETYIVFQ